MIKRRGADRLAMGWDRRRLPDAKGAKMVHVLLFMAAATLDPRASDVVQLELTCSGQGTRVTHESGAATAMFSDQVDVSISGSSGRIRVPPIMLPEISSGGSNGWWQLHGLVETPTEFRATIRFNFMNKPIIRIDRLTGNLTISAGRGNYSGKCMVITRDPSQRQF